jgi:hypothetical protein
MEVILQKAAKEKGLLSLPETGSAEKMKVQLTMGVSLP